MPIIYYVLRLLLLLLLLPLTLQSTVALACRKMSFHFFLSATSSLHLLTPSTWRSRSTSSFHLILGLPLLLVPSSSWVKFFLGILSSSILSRCPNLLIHCPFIHFSILCSSLLVLDSSDFSIPRFHILCVTLIIINGKIVLYTKRVRMKPVRIYSSTYSQEQH